MTLRVSLDARRTLVFGMSWEALIGDSQKAEIASSAKKLKAKRVAKVEGIDSVAGFDIEKPAKGRMYSAAAIVATTLPPNIEHALLFYALPDDVDREDAQVALIGIRDRVPAVGFDQVGALAQMTELGRAFIRSLDGRPVTTYFDGEFENAQMGAFQPCEGRPIFDGDLPKEAMLVAPPGSLGSAPAFVAVGVLVCVGMMGWHFWKQEQANQARKQRQVADPMVLYAQSRDKVLGSEFVVPASEDVTAILAAVRAMPTSSGGWRVKDINCTARACLASWESTSSTYDDFRVERGNSGPLFYSIDGQSLTEALVIPQATPRPLRIDRLLVTQKVAEALAPWFQTLKIAGVTPTFRPSQLVGVWPGGMSPPPGIQGVVRRGTWQFSGAFDTVAEGVEKLPEYMTVSSVSLRIESGGDLKLSIGGAYYVKG